MGVNWPNYFSELLVESGHFAFMSCRKFETYRRTLELPTVEEFSRLLQHVTINSQLSIQDENDHPSPTIGREQLIGEFVIKLKMILLALLVH